MSTSAEGGRTADFQIGDLVWGNTAQLVGLSFKARVELIKGEKVLIRPISPALTAGAARSGKPTTRARWVGVHTISLIERPTERPLSHVEGEVLRSTMLYGRGVDWGGTESRAKWRNAAKELIKRGLLGGSFRNSHITDAGRAALSSAKGEGR